MPNGLRQTDKEATELISRLYSACILTLSPDRKQIKALAFYLLGYCIEFTHSGQYCVGVRVGSLAVIFSKLR